MSWPRGVPGPTLVKSSFSSRVSMIRLPCWKASCRDNPPERHHCPNSLSFHSTACWEEKQAVVVCPVWSAHRGSTAWSTPCGHRVRQGRPLPSHAEDLPWSQGSRRDADVETCIQTGRASRLGGETLCLNHCGSTSGLCGIVPTSRPLRLWLTCVPAHPMSS
jgi:hypothetical protein